MTFRDLGILPETAEALEAVGIVHPFPIQEMTLPVALTGHDVIGQAKTGTGKTLGFGLPLIERAVVKADVAAGRATADQLTESPQALIVVPTRELCTQVTNDLQTAGKVRNVRVLAVYGGRAYEPQVEALKKGVDIVVGTPGRLLDLAGQRKLDLSQVRALVLDEADEMLDLGFLPDVEKIITMLPAKRQTLLFSATMPGQVISLARRYMSQPTHIRAAAPDDTGATVANIEQHIFRAHSLDKVEMVSRILQAEGRGLAMIFCRTKRTAADVADQLTSRGFAAGAVHGDLGQGAREQALRAFRNGKVDVLVCTDVAARGIDVEGVTHVINYQCTDDEKTYLHRIGRTGRAGASGTAVTLVDWDDIPRWQLINKALDLPFNDPEETYSTSPHLYELLRITPGTKGILPRSERTRAGLAAEEVEDLGETGGRGQRPARTGGGGGRGGRGAAAPEAPAPAERPRRNRERRRTRGGGSAAPDTAAAPTTPAVPAAEQPAPGEGRSSRRRNRNRRNSAAAPAVVETAVVETAPATPVVEVAPVAVEAPVAETPAARTPRKRTRNAAAPVVETVVEAAPVVVEAPVAEAPAARTPRKRTRSAAAPVVETVAEIVVETAAPAVVEPVAETPRKRTRKAAAAPVTEVTVETVEAPAPRKRAAKKAAVAEVVAEEAVAPAPRKRATKKAVTAVETPAEEAPAPRKRATKKAAAAEVVAEEAVAPAPRKRATKKAVAAVETPAEEIPAPRKRATRKAAAAEVVADEATPAPRKRTAKKAVETPAEEAPAPRKRATKKAAAAEVVADEATPAPRKRATKKAAAAPAAGEEIPAPRRTRKAVEK
ncbi:DEAD/DEAH box helicase [Kitasatospora sp. CB01950]|uniref:DEAD/DEAH box helicase n=1 Tax=Kitasatospora sp. CB01950 TaxID=1703930 RepID=UPI0009FAE2A9|nr:DEAD/DEAH box helicase [Kitasatospora sp. CB01950]